MGNAVHVKVATKRQHLQRCAACLLTLGMKRGDFIGVIAEFYNNRIDFAFTPHMT